MSFRPPSRLWLIPSIATNEIASGWFNGWVKMLFTNRYGLSERGAIRPNVSYTSASWSSFSAG